MPFSIMPNSILKQRVQTSFHKSLYSYSQHAVVQTQMAEELLDRLEQVSQGRFNAVLEIGCGSGVLTERFLKRFQVKRFHANDIVKACEEIMSDIFRQYPGQGCFEFLAGDIETMERIPQNLDLVISNAAVQWLDDFEGFLSRIRAQLTPNAILAFSTFGPRNLEEIRALSGNSLDYLSLQHIEACLKQHFQRISCTEARSVLSFSSPRQVLNHLRLTGVNGISKQRWTKTDLQNFERRYQECFKKADGTLALSYHPILCLARKA
ncbi:malonyl-[acyl-carrier protein] O-methyltransferase BioC [candidate division KSB3 bacterium]|uniref:Malonyl-[acyl-carrier protein] O-methyltransferase n=1 Tax=candidate division KSB3 bacterium TaxID=2044937 RepID=A0A2G6E601_9BACT|nr:MAG: malonyl-[acyl-carrier protein] O-methyltransferase BioC [candidate division KSB3 bacterium]PIE30088.1 MAG: malonyl-[acyl-carrier protein] O-methyltransferase BioC [candidate division KSB3 bacterium]